jgi:outer membrane autotransporter protein
MKFFRLFRSALAGATVASVMALAQSAHAQVFISAQYLGVSNDNTNFNITNYFSAPLTGATLSGSGYGGNFANGAIKIPTIVPGGQYLFGFDDSSTAFAVDFDDDFQGHATYTLKGYVNGRLISVTFSPDHNGSGRFVPFLGNGVDGFESDDDVNFTLVGPEVNDFGRYRSLNIPYAVPGSLLNLGTIYLDHKAQLTVNGDFDQWLTGHLVIGLKSKQDFGRLHATNVAVLGGGITYRVVNGFQPRPGQKFTFLTADNGVFGFFDTVEPTGTILGLHLIYEPNSVTMEIAQGSFKEFADTAHLSTNQRGVAAGLDRAVVDGRAKSLIRFLDSEPLSALPGDFDKVAPEELTSIFTISTALAQVQSINVQRRTDDLRAGANGFSAAGFQAAGNGPSYSGGFGITTGVAGPSGDEGKESKEMKTVVPEDKRWGAFLTGVGEWVSVGDDHNARGYNLDTGGFTLGVDYRFTSNFAAGVSLGYAGTSENFNDHGRVWVNGGKIGLYATFFQNQGVAAAPTMSKDSSKEAPAPTYDVAKGFYADFAATGGYNSYSTRRAAIQGDARGDADGGDFNALFGVGYDIKKGGLTFGPTASFNYTYVGLNSFTEHGSLSALNIHGGDGESLRTAFGMKASYECKIGNLLFKPEIRAAWQHEFGDNVYSLDSSFGGGSFTVSGPKIGRDSALLGAGFAIQCSERCSTYFYYDGELGRSNYHSTNVSGGVRFAF